MRGGTLKYQDLFPVPTEWVGDADLSLAETLAAWGEREVKDGRLEHREDYEGLLEPAMRRLFVELGLGSMLLPEESGGGGCTEPGAAMTCAVALESVGSADTGLAFLLANTLAVQAALAVEPGGDEALSGAMAEVFCTDVPAVASLVLPAYGAGSVGRARFNGLDHQVSAEKNNGAWTLKGKDVRPQCSGATADLFAVTFAGDDGAPALALVGSTDKGLKVGRPFKKTGLAASVNADLDFDGVAVTAASVIPLGPGGMRELLSRYYSGCAAACMGALLAAYEIIREWGDTRVIKGKGQVFKENPLVASLMGEIGAAMATDRLLTYDLARLLSRPDLYGPPGSPAMFATATAVFKQVSRSGMRALDNVMELMASAGYATEWNLERYWRDVKTIEAYVVPDTAAQVDMARHYFDLETI